MINVYMEMNFIAGIVMGFRERVETSRYGGYAVEREKFDDEGEVGAWVLGWDLMQLGFDLSLAVGGGEREEQET